MGPPAAAALTRLAMLALAALLGLAAAADDAVTTAAARPDDGEAAVSLLPPANAVKHRGPGGPVDVRSAAAGFSAAEPPARRYGGHAVLEVEPRTPRQLDALRALFQGEQVDGWKLPSVLGDAAQFSVSPAEFNWTAKFLDENNLTFKNVIPDLQSFLDAQDASERNAEAEFGWSKYHRLSTMYQWMQSLAQQHAAAAALVVGGRSHEGRQILGVRIAHAPNLPVIYLEGGIHGREWISPAATAYVLHRLLTSEEPSVARLARSFEWHIFPSVNPDAYEYSHTTDRLWRKSRKRLSFLCYGADLNRNFPVAWGTAGVSWSFCSQTFPGTRAASEVETRSRLEYMEPLLPRMKAFVALHSFSQLLVWPWGHTPVKTATHDKLAEVGAKSAEAFRARHGTQLRIGNLAETLYPASGSAMDWAFAQGVPFSYTFELRDTGRFGFLLPADQIAPAAEETSDAILAMGLAILS